ncbi:hypothetical protein L0156_21390 [bacterium]|nr:hypothetical protein [bacterium]
MDVGIGNANGVRQLISSGANINTRNKADWTALMYTALFKNEETAATVVELGADLNVRNSDGKTLWNLQKGKVASILLGLFAREGHQVSWSPKVQKGRKLS